MVPLLKGNIMSHLRVRALETNGKLSFTCYITMRTLLNLPISRLPVCTAGRRIMTSIDGGAVRIK